MTTIVVGYTADPFGQAALEHGIAEATLRGGSLLVINATAGESYVDKRFAGDAEVHDVEARLADCGVSFELVQPVGVDPADELLAAMDRTDAELLVVGIRHRNPVGKLLLGSVAQKLILECPKPVLAVKPAER
jgi:nucleotide-binding universal stress UspA family protein